MQLHNHIITYTSHVTRAGYISSQTFSDLVLEITAAHRFSDCPHRMWWRGKVTFLNLIAGDILPIA